VLTYILIYIYYIDNIQERMTSSLSSDPAAIQSVSEDTVRWAPNDACKKELGRPEYVGRVRQVGENFTPVWGTSFSYQACSQAGPSQCTSRSCSIHEGKIATMEVLLRAQTERNEALEQRMRHFETLGKRMRYFEAVLTSMGVSHTSPGAQQCLPPNRGSTSSVCNASVGMITIV
jgi:hypothetical protein